MFASAISSKGKKDPHQKTMVSTLRYNKISMFSKSDMEWLAIKTRHYQPTNYHALVYRNQKMFVLMVIIMFFHMKISIYQRSKARYRHEPLPEICSCISYNRLLNLISSGSRRKNKFYAWILWKPQNYIFIKTKKSPEGQGGEKLVQTVLQNKKKISKQNRVQ